MSNSQMTMLEIACFSAQSAIMAWQAGADRIELCADQSVGGTTPSHDTIDEVKRQVDIPVFAMIRPRGGDFCYSHHEFKTMKADIERFKSIADGFVFGILSPTCEVDAIRTAELVDLADPLPCTFHRAIDEVEDLGLALEAIISAGCHAILSSGGKPDAFSGAESLGHLVHKANGRLTVIPGGGVRASNLAKLRDSTAARAYHSSGLPVGVETPDPVEIQRMKTLLCAESDDLQPKPQNTNHAGMETKPVSDAPQIVL